MSDNGLRIFLPSCPWVTRLLCRLHHARGMVQETKVSNMKQKAPSPSALRVADLPQNTPTSFSIRPETPQLQAIAYEMDLLSLRKLSFEGKVVAEGADNWRLARIDGNGDERDHPFILGATNLEIPSWKSCILTVLQLFHEFHDSFSTQG